MKIPSLIAVLGLIFGIVILGVITLQRDVLVLAIPLMVYLFAAIFQRPEEIKLDVTRDVSPHYVPQGTPVTVKLTITNQGAAIAELSVRDVLPDGAVQTSGESSCACSLARHGKIDLEYTVQAQRGAYTTYETTVHARDGCDLFAQSHVYRNSPHFVIQPRYPKLERIKIHPPQTRGFAGPIASRQGGDGIDFWGIREYQTGDPQRQINWKLAARSEQELYVNVAERERVADVGLILDARHRTNVIIPSGSLFEHAISATAALAESFLNDGNRVSLLVYSAEMVTVFPGYGKRQHDRILQTLSKVQPGEQYALESLAYLPTRFFPAKSQIVLVSPLSPDDVPVIVRMRALGYAVLLISPDPIAYENAIYHDTITGAYRLAYAERHLTLRQLHRNGVRIVNWRVNQPLESIIREKLTNQRLVPHNHRAGM